MTIFIVLVALLTLLTISIFLAFITTTVVDYCFFESNVDAGGIGASGEISNVIN